MGTRSRSDLGSARRLVRLEVSAMLTGLIALGAGCPLLAPGGSRQPDVVEVDMVNHEFVPKEATVHKGDTVRWVNQELLPVIVHTATSGDLDDEANEGQVFDSGDLTPGQSFEHQFNEVGEFEYYCERHAAHFPAMRHAKVIVVP